MNLKGFTREECEKLRRDCNFTDDERAVFDLRVTGKDRNYIKDELGMSISTVDRRLKDIKNKIARVA